MRYVIYFSDRKEIDPKDVEIRKMDPDKMTDQQIRQIDRISSQSEKLHKGWDGDLGLVRKDSKDSKITRKWIKERGKVFICAMDRNGNVLGYIAAGNPSPYYKDTCWLSDISVDKSARGLGIGKRLVREALKELKSKGHHNVMLNVSLQNKPALGLYEKTGFRPWEYTMVKNL